MTTQQLIARFKQLSTYDLDIIGEDLSDASIVALLNEAQDEMSVSLGFPVPKANVTLSAGVGTYSLVGPAFGMRMRRIHRVFLGSRELRPVSLAELDRQEPGWRTMAPGVPRLACVAGSDLILVPPPSASVGSCFVSGEGFAPPLAANRPEGVPAFPIALHPHLAGLALVRAALPNATENQQFNRLMALQANAERAIDLARADLTIQSKSFLGFGNPARRMRT